MAKSVCSEAKERIFKHQIANEENRVCENRISFSSIYCLKAIGAFFVVCIHCFSPWQLFPIIRTAVPFFFMISGYFLYRKDNAVALSKCTIALKKILWITLYANIFYYIAFYVPNNLFPIRSLKLLVSFLTIGHSFGMHLWYLNAYIEALIIIMIALRLNILSWLWWCIPICIICGLIIGKYEFLMPYMPNHLIISRNFLTMGIPCFGIGWLLKQYQSKLLYRFSSPVLMTCVLLILSEFEIWILKTSNLLIIGDYLIVTFPLAASMLLIGIKYPLLGKNTLLEIIGKKYSLHIYIFHVFILKLFRILNDKILGLPPFAFPFIIFILTIVFVFIWKKCSTKLF